MSKETIKKIILDLYEEDNDIVNDRTKVLASVWRELGWSGFKSLERNLINTPSAESITRSLRGLISTGKVKLSAQEANRRFGSYEAYVEYYSSNKKK